MAKASPVQPHNAILRRLNSKIYTPCISGKEVQISVRKAYSRLSDWRAVGDEFGISSGMAWRIAHGYEPKTPAIRARLGLCAYAPAPVCPVHGVVHVGRCPREKKPRKIADMGVRELRRLLRERKELT